MMPPTAISMNSEPVVSIGSGDLEYSVIHNHYRFGVHTDGTLVYEQDVMALDLARRLGLDFVRVIFFEDSDWT